MKKLFIFCLYFLIFILISAAFTQDEWEKLALDWGDEEDAVEEALPEPVVGVVEAAPPPPEPVPAAPPPPAYQPTPLSQPQYQPPPEPVYQPPPQPQYQPPPAPVYQPPVQPQYQYPPPAPPPPPPAPVYQPPAPAQPQPPARTVVPPAITFVFGQSAPQPAPQVVHQAVPPSVNKRPINVVPQMPHPYSAATYRVQLGSYSSTELARQCFNRLNSAGFTPYYEQYGTLYRVVLVGVKAADMPMVVQRLDAAGFTEAWIREER